MMTVEERTWLIGLINDPPPGSKLAAAKEFGIDLTLLLTTLELTPTQRLERLGAGQSFVEDLRDAMRNRDESVQASATGSK